jgi:hypothetical protein
VTEHLKGGRSFNECRDRSGAPFIGSRTYSSRLTVDENHRHRLVLGMQDMRHELVDGIRVGHGGVGLREDTRICERSSLVTSSWGIRYIL